MQEYFTWRMAMCLSLVACGCGNNTENKKNLKNNVSNHSKKLPIVAKKMMMMRFMIFT